jgi:hypothetical protein
MIGASWKDRVSVALALAAAGPGRRRGALGPHYSPRFPWHHVPGYAAIIGLGACSSWCCSARRWASGSSSGRTAMNSALLYPVLPFAVAALLVPWVGVTARRLLSLAAPAAALAMLWLLPGGATFAVWTPPATTGSSCGRRAVAVFASRSSSTPSSPGSTPGARRAPAPRPSLGLAGAGVGVVLAGDLLSLFFFWEWLTVTSLFLIWFGNTSGRGAPGSATSSSTWPAPW